MKKYVISLLALAMMSPMVWGQKMRPDAFPPIAETHDTKAVVMAYTVEEMESWDKYPTYPVYVEMMQRFASQYPSLCRLDTIGTSIEGRLILCVKISDNVNEDESGEPEFFYSSTMHGDEVTGYYLMLHLIDTLLNGYGQVEEYTDLINSTAIYINPLSNPDGTYNGGNNTVMGAMRYNANWVDLNRNYPDPFGTEAFEPLQKENEEMIQYVSNHRFLMSANLHGGSEVMNYPWDSYESYQQAHPRADWWKEVSKRFVDTCRAVNGNLFRDVTNSGYIAGGDWYVISNGRQDYFNYYNNCLEMTMELSSYKTLPTNQLPSYWRAEYQALLNYIKEIHNLPWVGVQRAENGEMVCFPNPTFRYVQIKGDENPGEGFVTDMSGKRVMDIASDEYFLDLGSLPAGLYFLHKGNKVAKIVKR